jgi:ethanolamine utilization protein EutA (predicted chaperonin)
LEEGTIVARGNRAEVAVNDGVKVAEGVSVDVGVNVLDGEGLGVTVKVAVGLRVAVAP